jgi:hypothetical protein
MIRHIEDTIAYKDIDWDITGDLVMSEREDNYVENLNVYTPQGVDIFDLSEYEWEELNLSISRYGLLEAIEEMLLVKYFL